MVLGLVFTIIELWVPALGLQLIVLPPLWSSPMLSEHVAQYNHEILLPQKGIIITMCVHLLHAILCECLDTDALSAINTLCVMCNNLLILSQNSSITEG